MKFSVSTKPLKKAVDLTVIPKNVTATFQRSSLLQISATDKELKLNTESDSIQSEVILYGTGTGEPITICTDCIKFKSLISTISASQIDLDITESAITIHANKSTFTIPLEANSVGRLAEPYHITKEELTQGIDVDNDCWSFIKDHQMFAVPKDTTLPVCRYTYLGEDGNSLTGNVDYSLFTLAPYSQFSSTSLVTNTIINLMTNLPETAKMLHHVDSYVIGAFVDSYEYRVQLTPKVESEDVGYYNADMIMEIMNQDNGGIKLSAKAIITALQQSNLLADANTPVSLICEADKVHLKDKRIDSVIDAEINAEPFDVALVPEFFKSALTNVPDDDITIKPIFTEDELSGIVIESGVMSVLLGKYEG